MERRATPWMLLKRSNSWKVFVRASDSPAETPVPTVVDLLFGPPMR